nr:ribonuclease H-like domain-containing protein [Tanacetum cinerariifolium]
MTGNISYLSDYEPYDGGYVTFGQGGGKITGKAPQLPQTSRNTNPHVSTSTGVDHKTNVSRSQLRSNQMTDKVMPNNSHVKAKKTEVEDYPRNYSISNKTKFVTACNDILKSKTSNVNAVCATCGKCLTDSNHLACVTKLLHDVNVRTKKPNIVQLILFIVDSRCTKHMTGNISLLYNFVEKYLGSVRFGNDQFAPILGYGDLVQGNITINRVYYVKGLNHNLFSVGQFCDADLEVSFWKSTCFVRDLQGNDLLTDFLILTLKKEVLIGLPKLKYVKDQLCSSCEASDYDNYDLVPQIQNVLPSTDTTVPSQQELDLLFGPLYDEFFNAESPNPTNAKAEENNDNQEKDEFTNPFCTPIQEVTESSSHNIGNLNVHTFSQPQHSEYRWTKDHPLEQVRRNPSKQVQTRRQLKTDPEMCMFALTEVYVAQSDEFVDPDHPEKFYRLRKALYGLKQAPKGCRFEMSLMGEMKFFLELQIHQSPYGIFINQAKYALEILKKHGMKKGQSIGTPMATKPKLDADLSGKLIDQTDYRSKIRSLMYLTSSRLDIVQAVCYCARYQTRPTEKHLKEVKRTFQYLRGTIDMGLWYPKDSGFKLIAFSDADHARCIDTCKSTFRGIQFLGDKLVSWRSKKQDCTAMSSERLNTWRYLQVVLKKSYALRWKPCQGDSLNLPDQRKSYALRWKPCQGDSLNLPDQRIRRRCCSFIPAKSDSLPHAHAQTIKTYYKHQDLRIKKAQTQRQRLSQTVIYKIFLKISSLSKEIVSPYTPSTVIVPAVPATDDSPAVPEHTTVET